MKTENTAKAKFSFALFLVTIGIVYGDIGTSPLYVMKSIMAGNGGISQIAGDKCSTCINVYLRQIVQDLQSSGEQRRIERLRPH